MPWMREVWQQPFVRLVSQNFLVSDQLNARDLLSETQNVEATVEDTVRYCVVRLGGA